MDEAREMFGELKIPRNFVQTVKPIRNLIFRFCVYPDLWSVFRTHHGRENMCMSVITNFHTNVTAGESKINIVPALCDGPGSISLAWGTFASKLKPAPRCESRGMGAKLWHD